MHSPQYAPIRVLIADGDPRLGHALQRMLQAAGEVEVIACASEAAAILVLTSQLRPVVAVVDAWTVRLDGLALTRSLRQQVPAPQIVVVSVYAWWRAPALAAGACQFLLKDCSRAELVAVITRAAQGHCLPPENYHEPGSPRDWPAP